LLQQLQTRGLITEAVVARLKRNAIVGNESPEDIIGRERIVPDEQVAALKSELLKVPYKKIDPEAIDARLMGLVPEETARTYRAIPISLQDGLLIVGMLHPDDTKAQDAMKFIARQNHINLGVYLISYNDLQAALRKYSPYRAEVAAAVSSLNIKEGSGGQQAIELEGGDSADAPIIKIVADTFKEAVLNKASDVHIEPQQKSLRIRLRIDGDLREVASLPAELADHVTRKGYF
jgi:type II secretory ATPase GspE/PulE/Tfp pilus assembly ATPase PilB-like protein